MNRETEIDKRWMKEAYEEGLKAFDEGEVPIGAVVVKNNSIIGRGHNRVESLNDPTAHAEIIAISAACNTVSNWRLEECSLYVTVEPCLMCGGAILHSRIERVVYVATEPKFGSLGSAADILAKNNLNHKVEVDKIDFLSNNISNLMKKFFASKRERDRKKQKNTSV
jgi:tRNA(adenine34) deaminase